MTTSQTKSIAAWCAALLAVVGVLVVLVGARPQVQAQAAERVWYRIEQVGPGTHPPSAWRLVGEGFAGTYPFVDDFEIDIRPVGGVVRVLVRDGVSRVEIPVSCTGRGPRSAFLQASRTGGDQTFRIGLTCSATEPAAP